MANCGLKMTVLEYKNAHDSTVMFEDGHIVHNVEWRHFKNGAVNHPSFNRNGTPKHIVSIGDSAVMANGLKAVVTNTDPERQNLITVTFETGAVVGTTATAFVKKEVSHPVVKDDPHGIYAKAKSEKGRKAAIKSLRQKYIGRESVDQTGKPIRIADYTDRNHITVVYNDGCSVESTLEKFKNHKITKPNEAPVPSGRQKNIGMRFVNTQGDSAVIAGCPAEKGYIVRFENGQEKHVTNLTNLKKGHFMPPGAHRIDKNKNKYEGQEQVSDLAGGMTMRVTKYMSGGKLEVTFENGDKTITTTQTWNNGKGIPLPSMNHQTAKARLKYIGMRGVTINHFNYVVTDYATSDDVTVTFEDGTTKNKLSVKKVISGRFLKPEKMVGRSKYFRNGLYGKIIRYTNAADMDILFEDGTTVCHANSPQFCEGTLPHPKFNCHSTHNKLQINGFTVYALAYRNSEDRGQYFCKCNTCNIHDIMDTDEMKTHSLVCVREIH